MNVLVYTSSNFILERLIDLLIPNGVTVYHAEHRSLLFERILVKHIDCVLFDFTVESFEEVIHLIQEIAGSPNDEFRRLAVSLYVSGDNVMHEHVQRALEAGATSFLRSNADPDTLIRHIAQCCEKVQGKAPEMRYPLVKLSRDIVPENVMVKFRSPASGQTVMGSVMEISAGGMHIELLDKYDNEEIEIKSVLKNVEFSLLGHKLSVDAVVVARKFSAYTVLFISIDEEGRHELSQFIFMKLSGLI